MTLAPFTGRYTFQTPIPGISNGAVRGLFDMRLPLFFGLGDCDLIAGHFVQRIAVLGFGGGA